jgi:hypothetical protein
MAMRVKTGYRAGGAEVDVFEQSLAVKNEGNEGRVGREFWK